MWRGRGYHRQMRGGWEWGAGSAGVHREGSEHGAVTATDRRLRFKVTLTAVRGTGCTDEGVGARGPDGTRPADRGDGRRRADSGSSRSAGPRVRPRPARGTEPRGRGGCAQRLARASGPRRPGAWGRRSRGRLRPHAESPWQAGKPSLSSRFLDDRENAKSDGFRPTSVTELTLTARAGALAAPGSALRGKIRDV